MNETRKKAIRTENLRAMMLSMARGQQILESHPEIALKWKAGKHLDDLAKEYCPIDSLSVGINAVQYLIKKMIPDKERKHIAEKHKVEATRELARRRGKRDYEMQRGIWHSKNAARLTEGRKKGGQIGGVIVGKRNYAAGLGIAALTSEDLHRIGQRAARSRGEVPFEDKKRWTEFGWVNEKEYIISLKLLEDLSWQEITELTNQLFGGRRRLETIRTMFNKKWKKEIERKIEEDENKAQ